MLKSAFRSHSPLRLKNPLARHHADRGIAAPHVAGDEQFANTQPMANWGAAEHALVDALDEPALVVDGNYVVLANSAAQKLLGGSIRGRDVRLAIRHPQALERILAHRSAELDAT